MMEVKNQNQDIVDNDYMIKNQEQNEIHNSSLNNIKKINLDEIDINKVKKDKEKERLDKEHRENNYDNPFILEDVESSSLNYFSYLRSKIFFCGSRTNYKYYLSLLREAEVISDFEILINKVYKDYLNKYNGLS